MIFIRELPWKLLRKCLPLKHMSRNLIGCAPLWIWIMPSINGVATFQTDKTGTLTLVVLSPCSSLTSHLKTTVIRFSSFTAKKSIINLHKQITILTR
jgi:hypothetical protein